MSDSGRLRTLGISVAEAGGTNVGAHNGHQLDSFARCNTLSTRIFFE